MPFSNRGDGSRGPSGEHELPTVTFVGNGCVMAYWRNVLFVAWASPSTLSLIDELRQLMTRVTAKHAKISLVHIMFGAIPLPNKEARAGFAALAKDFEARTDHTAVLVGEAGFWASAVRSVMTSFLLNKRGAPKLNLLGSVAETARWLASGHCVSGGVLVDAGELKQAIEWVLDLPELRGVPGKPA